jgi:hypothetical protein
MKVRYARTVASLLASGVMGLILGLMPVARADDEGKPGISAEASAAIQQMGKTLSANDFSFLTRTIRVYQDNDGQPLHIFHTIKVVAHRPDRLAVHRTGDDGENDLFYDGKTVSIFGATQKKYATVATANNIPAMLDDVSDRLNVDFPLADFLDKAPDKAFLSGVKSGRVVGTVTIDDKPYRHLFFSQAGGIDLEVWLDNTQQAVPKRLIITYRLLPGQPEFIAEFSDWNFSAHASDTDFAFQPPAGATKIELPTEKGDK